MNKDLEYIKRLNKKGSTLTPLEAIKLKCYDCMYDPLVAGTWRQQIGCCISACCALHPHRPVPKPYNTGKNFPSEARVALERKLEAIDRARNHR